MKAGQCGSGLKNERKGGSKSNWRDQLEVVQAGPEGYVKDSEFWSKFHSKLLMNFKQVSLIICFHSERYSGYCARYVMGEAAEAGKPAGSLLQ